MWIRNKFFDAFFIWGLCSLLLIGIYASLLPILSSSIFLSLLLLIYLLFDGPHLAYSFTRSFFDTRFPKLPKSVVIVSWIWFSLPFAFMIFFQWTGDPRLIGLFVFFMLLYAAYHTIMQHYGFLRLYSLKNTVSRSAWLIGMLLPLFLKILFYDFPARVASPWIQEQVEFFILPSLGVSLLLIVFSLRESFGTKSWKGMAYSIWFCGIYYWFFLSFLPQNVFLEGNDTLSQWMIAGALLSLFHNVPFLGFFQSFHVKLSHTEKNNSLYSSKKILTFVFFFALIFMSSAWSLVHQEMTQIGFQIGFGLYYGILLQHYYLETKIWRFGHDEKLKQLFFLPK